jgi:hypothetical protein
METMPSANHPEATPALQEKYRVLSHEVRDTGAAFHNPDNPEVPSFKAKEQASDRLAAFVTEHGIRAIPDDFNHPTNRS